MISTFLQVFSHLEYKLDNHYPDWLNALRHRAFSSVLEQGFPTSKNEDWKYTRLSPILSTGFQPALATTDHYLSLDAVDRLAGNFGGIRFVFVNGHFIPELSSRAPFPDGLRVESLASALSKNDKSLESLLAPAFQSSPQGGEPSDAFLSLNHALMEDGLLIHISEQTTIDEPITVLFLSDCGATPLLYHPKLIVNAGKKSRAAIIEIHTSILDSLYFTNVVSNFTLGDSAEIAYYKVQNEGRLGFHFSQLDVHQGQGSQFSSHLTALGAAIGRHAVRADLSQEHAAVSLNGLYLPDAGQYLDHPIFVSHTAAHCTSKQLYKGVVGAEGRGGFYGKIVVAKNAMKTDASQTNKNLLLSESSQVETRPRLEILADDVKCAHGATVGQISDEALFYLRSRGIGLDKAKALLTYGFVSEMLNLVPLVPLRNTLSEMVLARLKGL
ncbi:MAG: Fe-S cluster assembly protein SufD [Nitrospirota bacterium]